MRLLVLDGNSIVNRAFYGIKLLSTKDGQYTNALVGFLNILQKLQDIVQPDRVAVAFDLHAPTFRHQLYTEYKAGRKGMPDELRQQMPLLKEILTLMGFTLVEKESYEADDILGTLSAAAAAQGGECFLATGDRDALQLVDDHTTVLLAATKMGRPDTTAYDPAAIREKYDLEPSQLIDLKALMGDTSDNIPGVPGIGEKTALDLLHRFHSLDEIFSQLPQLDIRDNLRQKLLNGKQSAYLSRELGTICRTVPIETSLDHYQIQAIQREPLALLLARLEMFKYIDRLGLNAPLPTPALDATQSESFSVQESPIRDGEAWPDLLAFLQQNHRLDLLPEWEGSELQALWVSFDGQIARFCTEDKAFSLLLDQWEDPALAIHTHDSKPLYAALMRTGRKPIECRLDTLLAAYLLNPLASSYDLPRLAQEYAVPAADPSGDAPLSSQIRYFSAVADRLAAEIESQQQADLLTQIEIPLAHVLAAMENDGFEADREGIARFGLFLQEQIESLQQQIYTSVGYTFNLNSPKQLAKALFEDLGLPPKKKTKSGYSTDADVLESLREAHPAVSMLLEYRTLAKLKSTYCDGLLKVIQPDGRIHSSFNQTETRTGRISSTEPNLQNIPVRQELGRELRRFFRAREGWVLCDADYSQIELRVLAHMAAEPTMMKAFNSGDDIHRITASQVFGVPEELVSPLMRSRAKAVNFGIIYGIGAHSLSQDIGVSYGEAKDYIDGYLHHYSLVAGFMERLIETAKETGYAETLLHRRRPLPELRASNRATRAFGERVARNMPIQGTAADIIKIAMVRVYRRLEEEQMKSRLILQVHDELLVEAPEEEASKASVILQEEMENAVQLSVKLAVDVHTGKTWYDAKG